MMALFATVLLKTIQNDSCLRVFRNGLRGDRGMPAAIFMMSASGRRGWRSRGLLWGNRQPCRASVQVTSALETCTQWTILRLSPEYCRSIPWVCTSNPNRASSSRCLASSPIRSPSSSPMSCLEGSAARARWVTRAEWRQCAQSVITRRDCFWYPNLYDMTVLRIWGRALDKCWGKYLDVTGWRKLHNE